MLLKLRKRNRVRQRRYRLNQTDVQKKLRKERDRIRKRLTREQEQLAHYNSSIRSNGSTHATN